MLKRFAKSAFTARIAPLVIGAYIKLTHSTSRWTIIGREHFDVAEALGKGVIIAFWHGRLMMSPVIREQTDKRVFMLISAHRDGEIIAEAVRDFDIEFIRGSAANPKKPGKNKRGASAIAQMLSALEDGQIVGVTPDGPRGPGQKVQPGVIKLAQLSGAPILPVANSMSRGRVLGTWDKFLLGAPFSRAYYVAAPALLVPDDNDPVTVETARKTLENALLGVTHKADALSGRSAADQAGD